MQKCINCGHENRPGVMFCENCGVGLSGQPVLDTKMVDSTMDDVKSQLGINESVLTDVRVQGAAVFGEQDVLRLEVEGSPDPLIVKPSAETIFGRRDPATGAMPDVDLTPFAGYRMGVSRRHAAIRFGDGQNLNLWDLGSSNGTYLNGERLNAHRPYRLHDGDELRLGQMLIRIRFQPTPKAPEEKPAEPAKPETPAPAEPAPAKVELPSAPSAPVTDEFVLPAAAAPAAEKPAEMPTTNPVNNDVPKAVEPTPAPDDTTQSPPPAGAPPAAVPPSPDEKRD